MKYLSIVKSLIKELPVIKKNWEGRPFAEFPYDYSSCVMAWDDKGETDLYICDNTSNGVVVTFYVNVIPSTGMIKEIEQVAHAVIIKGDVVAESLDTTNFQELNDLYDKIGTKFDTIEENKINKTMTNYKDSLISFAKANIKNAEDAGCGMYNFPIAIKEFRGKRYIDGFFQVYPYEDNIYGNYGKMFILLYYYTNEAKGECDNDCYYFEELTDEEKEYFYNMVMEQNKVKEDNVTLSSFVKKDMTLEEKVKLFDAWEEDRGSDGEYVYDLDNKEDAWAWVELYGIKNLYVARQIGRYWLGGWQFEYNGANIHEGNAHLQAWNLNDESLKSQLTDNNLFFDIEERYHTYMNDSKNHESAEETAEWVGKIYRGLIDFVGYAKASGEIVSYNKFMWIAMSNDGAYEVNSEKVFDSEEECYNDMRQAVLDKMKWNTEYREDLADGDVEYDVRFSKDEIVHCSYSGKYVYLIVPCDDNQSIKPSYIKERTQHETFEDYVRKEYHPLA